MQMNRRPERTARGQREENRADEISLPSSARRRRKATSPPLPDLKGVVSANECSGAVPAMPPDDRPEN